jgi:hypothetical protein
MPALWLVLPSLALLLTLPACAPEPRDDAGALLAEIDALHARLEARAPEARAARRHAVEALAELEVPPVVRPARDRCAALYGALVDHEVAYAEVSALLDRYEPVPRADWPSDLPGRLRTGYAAAEEATARANQARAGCEAARASLRHERLVADP